MEPAARRPERSSGINRGLHRRLTPEAAMSTAQETTYEQAVDKCIKDNLDQIKAWLAKGDG